MLLVPARRPREKLQKFGRQIATETDHRIGFFIIGVANGIFGFGVDVRMRGGRADRRDRPVVTGHRLENSSSSWSCGGWVWGFHALVFLMSVVIRILGSSVGISVGCTGTGPRPRPPRSRRHRGPPTDAQVHTYTSEIRGYWMECGCWEFFSNVLYRGKFSTSFARFRPCENCCENFAEIFTNLQIKHIRRNVP